MLQRERLTQETGPVPIYTSTSPEPEPSSPSAVALYMSSHERHLTKSPSLPHLHKSGAASTAWGTTQGLAEQQRHWQGVQDRTFLLGSNHKPRVKNAPRIIPMPPAACSHLHKPLIPPGSHISKQHHCTTTILQVEVLMSERCFRESELSTAGFGGVHREFGKDWCKWSLLHR